jgi:S-DNA-T family DNA segregation ATPase FtsK/SpoIIIE
MKYITPAGSVFKPYCTMLSQPHLLIAGATGSGKSVLINSLISTALYDSPAKKRFVLLDPKTTELWPWARLPHCIRYAYETDEMIKSLRDAVEIMENRLHHMHSVGERVWTGSEIYIIIDELADLLTTAKADAVPLLQRICQLGRAAGIHCVAATQCLLASVLPTQIRVNFPAVVCLRTATKQQSRFICDRPGAELFPDPKTAGKALAFFRTGADVKQFEVYRVPDDEQQRLVSWWTSPACTVG